MTMLHLTVAVSRAGSDGMANTWYVGRSIRDAKQVPRIGDLVAVGHRAVVGTNRLDQEFARVEEVRWDGDMESVTVWLTELEFAPGRGLFFDEGWLEDPDDSSAPSYH